MIDIFVCLHKPSSGEILANGKSVHENRIYWQKKIGYVPQNIYLLDDTIKNNIAYGIDKEFIDNKKIEYCIKNSQLSEFINSLPLKEETIVGNNGVRISGGQKQRIGIARALYIDPEIIVFDEATSSLDEENEDRIMRDIDSLDYECIKIIVTHRLKTVKNCDEIYVLNNGLIIDHGKFDDLKNRGNFVVSVSNEKKVFISLTADNIHHGHINLINEGKKYGNVVIGLLTDKAVATHKKLPILNYEQRKLIIKNISGVSEVIPQPEWDDSLIIDKVKPDIVIHGDDWVTGKQATLRKNVINILKKYGGKLIEVPYTKGISSEAISNKSKKVGISPDQRIKTLRRSIQNKDITRIIETHSPISALIAENAIVNINGKDKYFDGFWSSSLTDASLMGKPDIEVVDISKRLEKY